MRRLAFLTAPLIAVLAIPASALAREKIEPDRPCYVAGQHGTIGINGSGFSPNQPFTAYSGDQPGPEEGDDLNLNLSGTTGPDGSVKLSFPTYKLEHGARYYTNISVRVKRPVDYEDYESAETQVRMTTSAAGFYTFQTPRNTMDRFGVFNKPGNARAGRVLAGASGAKRAHYRDSVQFFYMGSGDGTAPPGFSKAAFLHYIDPSGKFVRTEGLAAVRVCGSASTLSGRYLFRGQKKPKVGTWKFQFDLSKRYSPRTKGAKWIYAKVARSGWVTFPGNVVYDYAG